MQSDAIADIYNSQSVTFNNSEYTPMGSITSQLDLIEVPNMSSLAKPNILDKMSLDFDLMDKHWNTQNQKKAPLVNIEDFTRGSAISESGQSDTPSHNKSGNSGFVARKQFQINGNYKSGKLQAKRKNSNKNFLAQKIENLMNKNNLAQEKEGDEANSDAPKDFARRPSLLSKASGEGSQAFNSPKK